MIFYWRGIVSLSEELMTLFWSSASPEFRGDALDFIGRSLQSDKEETEPNIIEALKSLWDQRLTAAQVATNKADHSDEMAAFGWWFSSGKFDQRWSSQQYLKALEIATKTQSDYFVCERLVELVKTFPVDTIRILSKLVLADQPGWMVIGNKDEINTVLSTALQSPEEEAKQEATILINRLVANGYPEFGDLLK
jgi:hypothetical protein